MTENKRFNRFDVYFDDVMQLWTVSDNENDNMLYPCTSENMANEFCKLLNELNDENKELRIQYNHIREQSNEFHRIARENANRVGQLEKENKELKARIKELRNDLIDHSALIKMLENARALDIEDMIWNTMGYKTETEFDDDFADYRENAKKRWRE